LPFVPFAYGTLSLLLHKRTADWRKRAAMQRTVQNRPMPTGSPLAGSPLVASLAQNVPTDQNADVHRQLEKQADKTRQWKVGCPVFVGR
jgi:hypothetical protein